MKVSGTKEAQYMEGRTGVKYTESIKITCVHAKVLQLYLTLCNPPLPTMDHSPPGSSVHGILLTRILEWVVMPSSRGSSCLRDQTHVSCVSSTAGRFFTAEPCGKPQLTLYYRSNYASKANPKKKGSDLWSPQGKGAGGIA